MSYLSFFIFCFQFVWKTNTWTLTWGWRSGIYLFNMNDSFEVIESGNNVGLDDYCNALGDLFEWVIEGVLIFVVGNIGLLGNCISIWLVFANVFLYKTFSKSESRVLNIMEKLSTKLGVHFIKLNHHFWHFEHLVFFSFKMPILRINVLLFSILNAKSVR